MPRGCAGFARPGLTAPRVLAQGRAIMTGRYPMPERVEPRALLDKLVSFPGPSAAEPAISRSSTESRDYLTGHRP